MSDNHMKHEIVSSNDDIEVRFYYSEDSGSYVPPHWHESLEFVYVLSGSLTQCIAEKKLLVEKEQFCFVDSKIAHSVFTGGNKALVLQIPRAFISRFVENSESLSFSIDSLLDNKNEAVRTEIGSLIVEMWNTYKGKEEGYRIYFESLLLKVLYLLVRFCSYKVEADKSAKRHYKIDKVMRYIKDNYHHKCRISEIADHIGSNPDYLNRIFKQSVGMTLTDYLYRVRIIHVYKDLLNTDLPVSEVFYKNGCSNMKVAMKVFKEIYLNTPKKIRNNLSSINPEELKKRINKA